MVRCLNTFITLTLDTVTKQLPDGGVSLYLKDTFYLLVVEHGAFLHLQHIHSIELPVAAVGQRQ